MGKIYKEVIHIGQAILNLSSGIITLPEYVKLTKGNIVGIYFTDTSYKERFINTLKSGKARKLLHRIQTDTRQDGNFIDYVDENIAESTLSVSEYLKLYGMIKNIYNEEYPLRMDILLDKVDLIDKKNISMKELKISQQKSVRVLASCLNNLFLFVGNNLLVEMDTTEKKRLYDVLSIYLKKMTFCVVIEDSKDILSGFADIIYEI